MDRRWYLDTHIHTQSWALDGERGTADRDSERVFSGR